VRPFFTQYSQVRDGDTEGISKAAKLIEALQGSSAGSQPPDAPGGVDDELADAIAAAAIDEGDDVDTLGKNLFPGTGRLQCALRPEVGNPKLERAMWNLFQRRVKYICPQNMLTARFACPYILPRGAAFPSPLNARPWTLNYSNPS